MTDDAAGDELAEEWRAVATAAELLSRATPEERAAAERLLLDQVAPALRSLGLGLHRMPPEVARIRSNESAFRIESQTDYVVHDAVLAAGVVRAHLRRTGRDIFTCLDEPFEEDEMDLLTEILFQEIPSADWHGAVEKVNFTMHVRGLTESECASGRMTPADQLKNLFG